MLAWLVTAAVASPWVEEPGRVRLGLSAWASTSNQQFAGGEARGLTGPLCPDPVDAGQRMPYSCVTGGAYTVRGSALDASVGVLRILTLDIQVPVVAAAFTDTVGTTRAAGLSDTSFGARAGSKRGPVAWATTVHTTVPTGPGDFQDRDVPLGTGQWDVVPGVRVGISGPDWGWAELWQSLAVRLRSPRTGTNPGDEWRSVAAVGLTPVPWGGIAGRVEGMLAVPDRDSFGLRHPGRSLLQLRPSLFARPTAATWVELGVAIPVAGRRWPAAAIPTLSLAVRPGS